MTQLSPGDVDPAGMGDLSRPGGRAARRRGLRCSRSRRIAALMFFDEALFALVAADRRSTLSIFYQGMVVQLVRDVQDGRRDHAAGELLRSVAPVFWQLLAIAILFGIGVGIGFVLLIIPGPDPAHHLVGHGARAGDRASGRVRGRSGAAAISCAATAGRCSATIVLMFLLTLGVPIVAAIASPRRSATRSGRSSGGWRARSSRRSQRSTSSVAVLLAARGPRRGDRAPAVPADLGPRTATETACPAWP